MFQDQELQHQELQNEHDETVMDTGERFEARPRQKAQAQPEAVLPKARTRGRRVAVRLGLALVGLLALGAGGAYGHYWWTTGRYLISTDDAYVGAKNATLSPKVSGYISEVA